MFAQEVTDSQNGSVQQISYNQRLSLAKDFVARLKNGLSKANKQLYSGDVQELKKSDGESNVLEDGEILLLQPLLKDGFRPGGLIVSQISRGGVTVSIADFAEVLRLAIDVDDDGKTAKGWFIREENLFSLDMERREVVAPQGTYTLSDNVFSQDGDIYVPVQELGLWLGIDAKAEVSYQQLKISSAELLPVQELEARKKKKYTGYEVPTPSLPLGGNSGTKASVPVVDVSTRSTYKKQGAGAKGESAHQANIKTVGDFAGGTLTTQSLITDENQLARSRVTYEKNSLEGDLLGRFEAKHLEIGDVRTTSTPIGGGVSQELGVRITNADPGRIFTRASTSISGNAIPGWDVELYRHSQFLGIVHIGDDGFYSFEDVTLFSDNNFRLVFHGPQGEKHEEAIYVPFDREALSQGEGVYDVSVSFDGQNTFVKNELKKKGEDIGSTNIAAMYEKPLAEGFTGSVGFHSQEHDGRRDYVGSAGLVWARKEALINANVGVDNEGEGAANFSLRRDFGAHEMNYTSKWRGAGFDEDSSTGEFDVDTFENALRINGPLPFSFGDYSSSRYNTSFTHEYESGGKDLISSVLGLNMNYRNVSFYGDLRYKTGNELSEDRLDTVVNLDVRKGDNNFRLSSDYEIKPEAELDRLALDYSRHITKDVKVGMGASKNVEQSVTDYYARLDWQAGFVRISPNISYNSNENLYAGLSTRFGLMREPSSGDIKMYDKAITANAFLSALVYLDKDGDGKFGDGDELLPDVVVSAPQNGRRAITDENGVALFDRMIDLRLTDVFVDVESLPDPAWIPGFDGLSILPRQGYVAQVEFPIHMAGELDGVVFANVVPLPEEELEQTETESDVAQIEPASGIAPEDGREGEFDDTLEEYVEKEPDKEVVVSAAPVKPLPVPLRNIELQLFNDKGEIEESVMTDVDGFYYFTGIPPGRYYLMISEQSAKRKNVIRPKPEPIEITYEGTLIYDHRIYVETGAGDVPSEIIADLKDYKERHPHVKFADGENEFVLNFGEYNSRLLMALVWYKLRTQYGTMFGDHTEPMVPPAESFADIKTGKHILRVGLDGKTIDDAYSTCRSFMARDQYCKVEITPSYMSNEQVRLAKATITATDAIISDDPMALTLPAEKEEMQADALMVELDEEVDEPNPFMRAVGKIGRSVSAVINNTPSIDEETEEERVERIRLEEEEAIKAMALDEELVRQIRARIDATASAAATGRPVSIAAPSKVLIP